MGAKSQDLMSGFSDLEVHDSSFFATRTDGTGRMGQTLVSVPKTSGSVGQTSI